MTSSNTPPRGALHIGLWVVQVLLALAFIMAGAMKLTQPLDALLASGMTFIEHVPGGLVRFIGLAEVLGGIGLVAPAATRIAPKLTGIAGAALAVVMVFAAVAHIGLGEFLNLVPVLVLGGLASFVAWGRLVAMPIPSRST